MGWDSGRSIACYAIGAVGVIGFLLAESAMGDDALIPLRIFRLRAAAVVIGASVIVGAAMFGAITVLPQYMQIVHGASPTEAGLMMLPMVVGMMTAGITVGQVTSRTGKISMSLVLLCGGSVMILAFLILLLMPAVELRKTSASAAARADQAEADAAAAPVPDA